ncbi:uncharacterized protein LOC143282790 [Babylonia areolata]|uniref:uncharacterized protein LOC143282790 n=1 Tax=Babylonia areolata TaxID=304850 RepID=UPI003FD45AF9
MPGSGGGKKKPHPPPKPLPKPAHRPLIQASRQQPSQSPGVSGRWIGSPSMEQSPVISTQHGSEGVRTRKRRSQEQASTEVVDKQMAVGDGVETLVVRATTHQQDTAVNSQTCSAAHSTQRCDRQQGGEPFSTDTAGPTRVRCTKRRSGDNQGDGDLRPVKRRSSDKTDFATPVQKNQPSPSDDSQSPAGQREWELTPNSSARRTRQYLTAVRRQSSGKGSSPATATRQSSGRTPVIVNVSRTSVITSRQSNTVTRQGSSREGVGSRQSNDRVRVMRQDSDRSSAGRRQSAGRGAVTTHSSGRRQSGGRGTVTRTDSGRRQSGGRGTVTRTDSGRRQSGGRGTVTRTDSGRRQSGGRGTVTRTDSSRRQSAGQGTVTRSGSTKGRSDVVSTPQGPASTPVRTNSSARRRSGVTVTPKRSSIGSAKCRRDSGSVKRSDSGRGHRAGGESSTPSRSSSFRKQGSKPPQSPTFIRITRRLGVTEEQGSGDGGHSHTIIDDEQAQTIIAGLQKAQNRRAGEPADSHMVRKDRQQRHPQGPQVQGTVPRRAASVKRALVVGQGGGRGEGRGAADMETDIDSWEDDDASPSESEEVHASHFSTLV